MSVDTTIAVLWAQTTLGTQFAHAAQVGPHAQAAMSRLLALETAKQEQHVIEKSSKSEKTGVNKDGGRKQQQHFGSRHRQRQQEKLPEDERIQAATPFTGNLLNVKV
ncbi:MAG: hypothetical protein IJU79_04855 [Desulfovibrionaceae bacterium]|nr:hypothetical protein [Desulfovibrionaceae bacterium]